MECRNCAAKAEGAGALNNKIFAGVVIDQVHPSLDKLFHYSIPAELAGKAEIGMRVQVPFGPRTIQGYILSLDKETDIPEDKIKPLKKVLDPHPALSRSILPLIPWMKEEYHCLFIEAIRCFIPPGIRLNIKEKTQRVVYLTDTDSIEEWIQSVEGRSANMAAILRFLEQGDGVPLRELLESTGTPKSSVQTLEKKGYIRMEEEETYRNPWQIDKTPTAAPVYNEEQIHAIQAIEECIRAGQGRILLHGITGSGKTEVYMKAAATVLEQGKQVIVLVPEISLTPQTVGRFKGRFGDNVAILHSGLSLGERYDEWRRIRNNEVQIVVGARSAVFAPLERLGLIIIDEAHEDSYKSDVRPRYHARDLAAKRCELEGAVLVLGSATPSMEDYYKAEKGIYRLVEMCQRAEHQMLPTVETVDMRRELEAGNRSIFSQSLYSALDHTLSRGEQTILLINRRGYAQFVSCRSCGHVMKCSNCDVSLTYHAKGQMLKCHYCGHQEAYPQKCPECGSRYIKHFGLGTQKVEEELGTLFPSARLLRMDMDTTGRKGAHHRILDAFEKGSYDILLGTQMVAKGLDFPNVTLVGVLAADASLNLPDYRSCEKTFQLITQVAGRTGRGSKPGRVVVQTYQPEHYSIQYASEHDFAGFYRREIGIRRQFGYPPYSHIIRVLITGEKEKELAQFSKNMVEWIKGCIAKNALLEKGLLDLGAWPAPIERINSKYRWQVLIRIRTAGQYRDAYHSLADELIKTFYQETFTVTLDFNPLSLI
jgi:primosomal protein N' (replication factor Y)